MTVELTQKPTPAIAIKNPTIAQCRETFPELLLVACLKDALPLSLTTIEVGHDPPTHIFDGGMARNQIDGLAELYMEGLLLAQQSGSTDLMAQFTHRLDALVHAE